MNSGITFKIVTCVILALHSSGEAVGRLTKRNGYIYKSSSSLGSPHAGGSALFIPQDHQAQHSAPDHEISFQDDGTGSGVGGPINAKYDDSYYDYKIAGSPASGPAPSNYHLSSGAGKGGASKQIIKVSSASSVPSVSYHLTSETISSAPKAGYGIGSGLRSIAQGSAHQAYSAVASQHAAAKQAAFLAKNSLAQAATQAAATAQAALEGKQILLHELQQQAGMAQQALSRELEQLKLAQTTAQLAQQTARAARNQISVLTGALNNAKAVADHADQAAQEVANQLASQSTMVGQAKTRLEQVEEQLKQATVDYEATKEAALKASSSAAEAQVNASQAAAHATKELHDSTHQHPPSASADDSFEDAQAFVHQVHSGGKRSRHPSQHSSSIDRSENGEKQ
ncbi:uncharacterized protein LOC101891815 [Musca domestica]|uniref:Uncharacterized protein LOC101891815 n=1 Tax=Musca domestica TaxID=7370 RepID=A0A1I8N8J7_MUSDO|nr:uncharacterized protein LOC101891815 [Musca domestica]